MNKLMITAVAIALSGFALADEKQPASATFEQIDSNHDGYISTAEAIQRDDVAKNWKEIDKNENGKVESDEFIAYESKGRFTPPEDSAAPEIGAAPMK